MTEGAETDPNAPVAHADLYLLKDGKLEMVDRYAYRAKTDLEAKQAGIEWAGGHLTSDATHLRVRTSSGDTIVDDALEKLF